MNNNYYVFVDKYDLIIKLQAAPYTLSILYAGKIQRSPDRLDHIYTAGSGNTPSRLMPE